LSLSVELNRPPKSIEIILEKVGKRHDLGYNKDERKWLHRSFIVSGVLSFSPR
jgi:hypothetical protein